MSVSQADMMTVLGETQQVMSGDNPQTAEYSAAIERQYAYEAEQRAEFDTGTGGLPLSVVPYITGAAFGALSAIQIGAPGTSPVQLWQQQGGVAAGVGGDPQVNFPRPGSPIYVPGTAPPPQNTMPVPYEPPAGNMGPWWGAGGIGALVGGVIGAIFESNMPGIGDLPDWFPNQLGREEGPYDTRAPSASPEVILSGPGAADQEVGPIGEFGPDLMREPAPIPLPAPYDFGDAHDRARKAMEDQLIKDMTTPVPLPPPAPAPAPTSSPGLPPWVWPLIGGLGAIQLGRAGRSRSSQTLPSVSPLPSVPGLTAADVAAIIEPLLSSQQLSTTNTYFQTQAGGQGVWDTGSETCNCSPRKSGKKRKCLARAQLSWRSGPKKGRAAGSRCYRFAN